MLPSRTEKAAGGKSVIARDKEKLIRRLRANQMKEKDFKSSVEKMLLKKAMGYKVKENVDEYASVGEEMKLVKRRITTKYVSPDLAAAKTLLELNGREEQNDLSYLSDEQLLRERTRLLLALESASGEEKDGEKES